MHVTNISAGGNSPVDFVNSFSNCGTATIAPSGSCTVTVVFAPIFSGPRSESLSVSDDAAGSPHVLNIVGNADPAFTITSGVLTATVSAGQTATYSLQLTPGVDYNGIVSFTCTGAPLGASCKAPPSATLNIGAPATYTITVPTSGIGGTSEQYLAKIAAQSGCALGRGGIARTRVRSHRLHVDFGVARARRRAFEADCFQSCALPGHVCACGAVALCSDYFCATRLRRWSE